LDHPKGNPLILPVKIRKENMSTGPEIVILAEDSPPNRKILTHLLEKMGFRVLPCENGQEAFESLTSGKLPRVDLIISDIMMPTMDGLELLRQVRSYQNFKTLPVVLITAVSERDYIQKARALNVNGYILKPVTFGKVLDKMKALFPNKKFPDLAA